MIIKLCVHFYLAVIWGMHRVSFKLFPLLLQIHIHFFDIKLVSNNPHLLNPCLETLRQKGLIKCNSLFFIRIYCLLSMSKLLTYAFRYQINLMFLDGFSFCILSNLIWLLGKYYQHPLSARKTTLSELLCECVVDA